MPERSHGMSLYDRDYVREQHRPQQFPTPKSTVGILLAVTIGLFIVDKLMLSTGQLSMMMVTKGDTILHPLQWWRFITTGFAHADMQHLFGNMLGLYFFGRAIEQWIGAKRLLWFYLTAVVFGGIGFSLRHLSYEEPQTYSVLGASGAVFALVILFALKYPRRKIYLWFTLPVPAGVLAAFYLIMELLSLNNTQGVAHDVHLIGAAYGFVFFKTGWSFLSLAPASLAGNLGGLGKSFSGVGKQRPKVRLYDPESKSGKLEADADRLLEKVHREGANSLTAKEKKTLEEYSRKMQEKRR